MKIRTSITAWLLLLVLLPTLPLAAFSIYSSYHYAEERRAAIELELVQRADSLAAEVRDRLAKSLGYVQSLSLSNSAKSGDIEGLYRFASRLRDLDTGISAISLIGPDNTMLFLTLAPFGQKFPTGQAAAVAKVFETAKPVLSSPFKSPISDKTVIALGVPIIREGKVDYVLRAIIRSETLNALLQPSQLPDGWIASLVGADGILVARSHLADRFVGQPASGGVLNAVADKNTGLWDGVTKEGILTRTVIRPVGDWGLYIALGVPKEILLEPLNRELLAKSLGGVTVLLLGIALAILVSRRITRSLRQTVDATKAVLSGEATSAASSGVVEFDQMRENLTQLDEYGRLLEAKVALRTQELSEAKGRLAHFATQLEDSVEAERQRISREVHDQIGAVLTGIKMIFRGLPPGSIPEAHEKGLIEALDVGVATARRIAAELRPPLIDDLGLQAAVEQLLETSLQPVCIGYSVHLNECECLNKRQTLGAYRIIQEATTNVVRHSAARHFSIRGQLIEATRYEVVMDDNGIGMPDGAPRQGSLGLPGMYERAELMGGTLTMSSVPQQGVKMTLVLPIITEPVANENPAA